MLKKVIGFWTGQLIPKDAVYLKTVKFLFFTRHYFLVDSDVRDFKRKIEVKPETVEAIQKNGSGVQWE